MACEQILREPFDKAFLAQRSGRNESCLRPERANPTYCDSVIYGNWHIFIFAFSSFFHGQFKMLSPEDLMISSKPMRTGCD
jgi:hypothetical protein